jgi:hypothetical protein
MRFMARRRAAHANSRLNFQRAATIYLILAVPSSRVPDAVQRSSRCSAEPGPKATRNAKWTPDQQRTTPRRAARCAASGARIPRPCPKCKHDFATPRRDGPSRAFISRPKEGVGNAGCPLHPRPRVRFAFGKKHTSIRVHRNHPAFPHAMVLTAYVVLSSVNGLFCHRRQRIRFCLSPVGPTQLRRLDTSVGVSGPHDFAVRCNISRPLAW